MKKLWFNQWSAMAALAGITAWTCVAAEKAPTDSASPAPASEVKSDNGNAAGTAGQSQDSATLSGTTQDILKLIRAGVSSDVIKTYVESSPVAGPLSAADVIALKEKGVPDELIATLIRRSAEPASAAGAGKAGAPGNNSTSGGTVASAPAYVRGNLQPRQLDPESYDYWWYYYAYPRTLASANERVLSSYAPFYNSPGFYGYGYGYGYPPLPFRTYPHSTFSHPHRFSLH